MLKLHVRYKTCYFIKYLKVAFIVLLVFNIFCLWGFKVTSLKLVVHKDFYYYLAEQVVLKWGFIYIFFFSTNRIRIMGF